MSLQLTASYEINLYVVLATNPLTGPVRGANRSHGYLPEYSIYS